MFRSKLVPRILQPRSSNPDAIFAEEYFSDYVVPEVSHFWVVESFNPTFITIFLNIINNIFNSQHAHKDSKKIM